MILYHISDNFNELIELFYPRVPKYRAIGEEDTIKIICVSHSITGCMTGVSYCMDFIRDVYCREYPLTVRVYEFDTDLLSSKIIEIQELLDKEYVLDANLSVEIWITENVKPTACYDISNIRYILDENFIKPTSLKEKIISKDFEEDFDVANYSWNRNQQIIDIKYDLVSKYI